MGPDQRGIPDMGSPDGLRGQVRILGGQVWAASPVGCGAAGRGCPDGSRGRVARAIGDVAADVIEGGWGNALAGVPVVPYAGAVPDGGRQGSRRRRPSSAPIV